ncbi:hypothetical protein BOX15_Mlig029664g9 [Macrostomum lignano]|uniref:Integrase catalytic domain-containing protein n=1 Tax=Macrostomum lignano TaxID=282301 RepID=A0A267GGB1_9PLAT|nr:hypothetical protein BOX15_Mlig029664g9 [Macrostomum lignano]
MNRIVLPRVLRETALAAVHSTHLGVEKSKSILREQFWWPQMDRDIADYIGRCNVCNAYKSRNKNFRHSWPEPDNPWERVHIDFAGPIEGKYLLIIVDAHSSYPEVFITSDMKADTVISRLGRLFSQQGVPKCLVSDNGPSFVSEAVTGWLTQIGCSHITTPAYHPQSNGIAERMVRTVKETIKTNGLSQRSIDRFLPGTVLQSCQREAASITVRVVERQTNKTPHLGEQHSVQVDPRRITHLPCIEFS